MNFLIMLGQYLLFTLLAEVLRPSQKRNGIAAGGLKDLSFPTVDATRPVQWLLGKQLIDNANLFGTWDFAVEERSKKVKTGLISSERVPLPPVYYVSAGMVLCGGSGVRLKRIFMGDRLVWEGDAGDGAQIEINAEFKEEGQDDYPRGIKGVIEFHSGSSTPSAYISAKQPAGTTPAWSHLTYVVLRGKSSNTAYNSAWNAYGLSSADYAAANATGVLDGVLALFPPEASNGPKFGAWIGTSKTVEHLKFECERMPSAASTGLGSVSGGAVVDGDASPAYGIAEAFTGRVYGAGLPASLLDAASFHACAATLAAEKHGTSQLWDSQRSSGEFILELCRQVGGLLVPNPATGLNELRLLRANDAVVLNIDDSNTAELQSFARASMAEATNALSLGYTDKSTLNYQQRPVEVQDTAAIEAAGAVITGTAAYAGIMNAQIALNVGLRDLRAMSAPLAAARVIAIVPKNKRLIPGDAVLFSSAANGVVALRMRVTKAVYNEPGQARCEVEMVEDVFQPGGALYSTPDATNPYDPPDAGTPGYVVWGVPPAVAAAVADPVVLPDPVFASQVIAPVALSGDASADHVLSYAVPNGTATSWLARHDPESYDGMPLDAWASEAPLAFSALVSFPSGTVLKDHATPTLMGVPTSLGLINDATAQLLRNNIGVECYAMAGGEWVAASVLTVSDDGSSADVQIVRRGLFGTVPKQRTLAGLTLLYAFEISELSLATEVLGYTTVAGHVPSGLVAGRGAGVETDLLHYRARTFGGLSTESVSPTQGASAASVAQLPLAAGAVRLQCGVAATTPPVAAFGVVGTSVQEPDEIQVTTPYVPTSDTDDELVLTFNPRARALMAEQPWAASFGSTDFDTSYFVSVDFSTDHGSSFSTTGAVNVLVPAGTTFVRVPKPAAWSTTSGGWKIARARITPYRLLPNGTYTKGETQAWHWQPIAR